MTQTEEGRVDRIIL